MYVGLTKKQKMLVARKIVDAVHGTGGRFIAKDFDTGSFYDIGLPRSLEKTSQGKSNKNRFQCNDPSSLLPKCLIFSTFFSAVSKMLLN